MSVIKKITTNFVEISVAKPYFGQYILHNKKRIGKVFEIQEESCKFEANISLKLNSQLELENYKSSLILDQKSVEYNQILDFNHIFFAKLYPIPRGSTVCFANLDFVAEQLKNSQIPFVTKLGDLKDEIVLVLCEVLTFEEIRKYQNLAGNYQEYSLTIFVESPNFGAVASFDGFKMKHYHLENWLQKNMPQDFREIILANDTMNPQMQNLIDRSLKNQDALDPYTFAKLELIYNKIEELSVYVANQKLDDILTLDLSEIISKLDALTII